MAPLGAFTSPPISPSVCAHIAEQNTSAKPNRGMHRPIINSPLSRDSTSSTSRLRAVPLKDILERELHLPHARIRRSNTSVVATGQTCVRQTPHWMVQKVKRLHSELQRVPFLRHAEVLVRREVPREAVRTNHRVPAGVSEIVDRLQSERIGIEPSPCGRIVQRLT